MSSVISVRIKKDLKQEAQELGINIRDVLEKALSEELERKRTEEFRNVVQDVLECMSDIEVEEFSKAIKESRRER